ncbi:ABC transporter ATP-binding protein [Tenggerimyces flavus]|uniref:ABC transporter ATP-binding protein n=1 Tax=Tenggerimyces flavus TaxID=1708749 RepID=A0ABV7Y3C3_9ACTN|nr:ABC transporter ATP-binding protein [Tenggerimyces flavus]MBM7790837.1 ABC-2 type transport system ATP-binding protein [Tenggerimyces flavus]
MAVLEARDVRRRFGDVQALDGFDLRIDAGEIVGLVGHNGAGKTTFVEIVAGLTKADSGTVKVDGIDTAARSVQVRERVGLAPQEISLYISLTVRENLRLFAGLAGLRGKRMSAAIDETSAALGLEEVIDRQVGYLSGGQKRRTQAATALIHRPRLLLLDEPTAGADPGTRRALLQLVRQCAADGAAVCYTTHYLPELADLDATIAVASKGKVIARGTQQELLAGLPTDVQVVLTNGEERVIRSKDPSGALAELLAQRLPLKGIDVRQPSLDDLYHALEGDHVAP